MAARDQSATKRNYVGRITKPCEQCGAPVTRKASQFRDRVFCGSTCYHASEFFQNAVKHANSRRHPDGGKRPIACLNCGAAIERHASQMNARNFCGRECWKAHNIARSARQTTSHGYVKVFVGTDYPGASRHGHIAEHRKVMQDHLGRPLLKHENVHHVNGVRDDNRVENLELWSSSQPSGQRVADKVRWAREFLTLYEDTTIE